MFRVFIVIRVLMMILLGWTSQTLGNPPFQRGSLPVPPGAKIIPPLVNNTSKTTPAPMSSANATDMAATCLEEANKSPIIVLSIDGAAVRGIAQFELLRAIEDKVSEALARQAQATAEKRRAFKVQRENLTDIFDFFAGTSAGSINVGSILIPDDYTLANTKGNRVKAKFSLDELANKLPEILKAAFSRSTFRKLRTLGGFLGSKLTAKPLEELISEYTGNTRMSDLVKPAVITSYDIQAREVINFSTHDACAINAEEDVIKYQPQSNRDFARKDTNVFLWQAIRGSTAANFFYKPLELEIGGKLRSLVDAGLYNMSPTLLAWFEVQKIYPGRRLIIISISGGTINKPRIVQAKGATAGNLLSVLKPSIEMAIEGQQVQTNLMMKELPSIKGLPAIKYHRLSFDIENQDFDNISEENIQMLRNAAKKTIDSVQFRNAIKDIADARLERKERNDLPSYICEAKERQRQNQRAAISPAIVKKIADAYQKSKTPVPISQGMKEQLRLQKQKCQILLNQNNTKEWNAMKCQNTEVTR